METIEEFKYNIKNNEQRKNFFINKFKNDLKRLNIIYDNNDLEKLLIEAIDSYDDIPIKFPSYGLNYIKEKLQIDSSKPQKNDIFSEDEMVILNLYLSKNKDGNYLKSDEIAKKLEIGILDVTQAVHKLNQNILYNYNKTSKIFNNVKKIISEREHMQDIRKINTNKTISDEDIEIIGLFTGQINDICLDIEEIAQEKNTSALIMKQRIEKIYELIYNPKNYFLLNEKYPNIDKMLRLKGKALGITLPKIYKNKSISSETPTTNEAQKSNINEDVKPKTENSNKIPTIKSEQEHQPEIKEADDKTILKDVEFLKYLYKPKSNNTYYSVVEIKNLLNLTTNSFHNKKHRILKKMYDSKKYKEQIYEIYPELSDDINLYNKKHNKYIKTSDKKILKDVEFLKCLYKKQDNGAYLSINEIANLLKFSNKNSVNNKKIRIMDKLNDDEDYKERISKLYPELYYDIKVKEQISNTDHNETNNITIDEQIPNSDYNETNKITKDEQLLLDRLYIDKTRTIETKKSYCEKLNISTELFDILNENLTIKLVKNKNLKTAYPNFEIEKEIITNYFNIKSITLSESELINIKNNSRKYDLPNYKGERNNLLKGIELIEKSKYSEYISLCTYEQKTMLALKFGYFNNTLYSTKNISNLFNVTKEEISILTEDCIKTTNKQKIKGK